MGLEDGLREGYDEEMTEERSFRSIQHGMV